MRTAGDSYLTKDEARRLVAYLTVLSRNRPLALDGLDLLYEVERESAIVANGGPMVDDPYNLRAAVGGEGLPVLIATMMAHSPEQMEAICTNVITYEVSGRKPRSWRTPQPTDTIRRMKEANYLSYTIHEWEEIQRVKRWERYARIAPEDRGKFLTPDERYTLAVALGAKISGDPQVARRIQCPSCDRNSVFFYIEPDRMRTARCGHRKSCGWWGFLGEFKCS